MQLLNNLFKVSSRLKNADVIYYRLMSLVFFQQENVKKSLQKHIFEKKLQGWLN